MSPKKVLFVLTNTAKVPGTEKAIGWWLAEVAHPFHIIDGKAEIVFASPKGGLAPVDPVSVEYSPDEVSQEFLKNHKVLFEQTEPLVQFLGKAVEFDAIYYPGGHGPMFDVATDPVSIQLVGEFAALDKTISAVCHGPAAFVNVFLPSGKHFLEGKKLTGLSNAEEDAFQMSQYMPFALETKLNEASGGLYTVWNQDAESATVVVENDGKFITGQNPKSGKVVGEAILKAIGVD
ncbi:hypothetical protein G7054_g7145 [Neopestalotiopsis clavispora]|nr:hypothetical protein G7054_g7145 [Neopestalotiopsis clavispora]